MKALRNLVIIGVVGWIGWTLAFQQGPGDRPSILVSNGPVRIEVQSDGTGTGEFQKGLLGIGQSWYHHHPAHAPSHFEVVVNESSCGAEARYDATELRVTSGGSGATSMVTISVGGVGPLSYLEVEPDTGTILGHDTSTQITMGGRDDILLSVRVAGSTCAFNPGQGSITINQRQ